MSSLKSRKRTERITNALCFIALIFLTCLCMLPIWWIFRSSLMSNAELFKWPPAFFPPRWLFSNYANTLEYFKFWTYLKNTMIIIVPSVIFGTITATMCGYAFARLRFRLRNFLFTLCVGSMLLPTMVTLIPLYIMWTKFFNMSNTFWPLILPYLCGGGAFNIFLIRQFVRSIPRGARRSCNDRRRRLLPYPPQRHRSFHQIGDDRRRHVPLHPDLERSAPADDLYQYG